jgi:hypothetical protein
MLGLTRAERNGSRYVRDNVPIDEIYDQLNALRDYVTGLTASAGRGASRQIGHAQALASEAAREAEEAMRDNLAASILLAVGLGIVVGYFIRRGSE